MKKKTHEKFIKEMKEKHPNIKITSMYINNKTKVECSCNICKERWSALPSNLLQKTGCPKCAITRQRKPIQDFLIELNNINPNIEILGDYINSQTKLLCRCKLCDNRWETKPAVLLRGRSCPKCGFKKISEIKIKSHEKFLSEMCKINPNVTIIGEYKGNKEKIECVCKLDGCRWHSTPSNLLHNYGCPECGRIKKSEKLLKSHIDFIKELKEKAPDIEVLGEYKGAKDKILCKCKKCSHKWEAIPNSLLSANHGCPKCNYSKGENIIYNFLLNNKISNSQQKTFDDLIGVGGGKLSYDFYLPNKNILIEYNGIQHYKPIEYFGGEKQLTIQQEHDKRKREYAKKHKIRLIEISYLDFNNIEKILKKCLSEKSA